MEAARRRRCEPSRPRCAPSCGRKQRGRVARRRGSRCTRGRMRQDGSIGWRQVLVQQARKHAQTADCRPPHVKSGRPAGQQPLQGNGKTRRRVLPGPCCRSAAQPTCCSRSATVRVPGSGAHLHRRGGRATLERGLPAVGGRASECSGPIKRMAHRAPRTKTWRGSLQVARRPAASLGACALLQVVWAAAGRQQRRRRRRRQRLLQRRCAWTKGLRRVPATCRKGGREV